MHGLRINATWGQMGPWRAQRFGASAGGRGCHMAHAFRGGGDEDVRGGGGGGGAADTKRKPKEAKLLVVIRRALADDDDEGEDDDQTLLQKVEELVKKMDDPKRKASFRSHLCSVIEKFDKISVGSSAANSKEGDKQTVNPTRRKQRSFYSADLWKTNAERYKENTKIQKAPRIIWNKGDVTSARVVIRALEEGVGVEGKTTVCTREQAKEMWELVQLHGLTKQSTVLVVNDGGAIPQDGAAQQWILLEGGVPQRFWVCGLYTGRDG